MSLDGQRIGTLFFKEILTRDVAPGPHRLRAYNTLVWKTVEFDARPGEPIEFLVTNYAKGGFWVVASLFGFAPLYVQLEQTEPASAAAPRT